MTEHPPVLRDANKRVVFEVACPAGMVHEGEIGYSRWPTMPLPERIALGHVDSFIEVREGVYDYASATDVEGAVEWHVNFAHPRLFTAYGAGSLRRTRCRWPNIRRGGRCATGGWDLCGRKFRACSLILVSWASLGARWTQPSTLQCKP
ncbi:MAG: hypothetical protein ACYC5V_01150 [Gemmatimonadaceae bacterium]